MATKRASIDEWAAAAGVERRKPECRSCGFPEEVKERIAEALTAGWGTTYISRYLADVFGIEVHPATLHNHLRNHEGRMRVGE